ncbi:MAG: polyphenol oxidase family protein [Thermoanaerobaculia bacterium]
MNALRWPAGGGALYEGLPPGISAGFTTLDLVPDELPPDEGARRFARLLGVPEAPVARLKQVHGAAVVEAQGGAPGEVAVAGVADAIVTTESGLVVGVVTADCVPIVLADLEAGVLAAAHAGWRGTAARVVEAALDALEARGGCADRAWALFGPSISRDAYEVGPDVLAALGDPVPDGAVVAGRGDRSWLDVAAFNEAALLRRGVRPERVVRPALCTFGPPVRFCSYRRDGERAGRIFTGAVLLPAGGPAR